MNDSVVNILLAIAGASFGGAVTWGILKNKVESVERQLTRLWESIEALDKFKNSTEPALVHYNKTEDKFTLEIDNNKSDIIALKEKVVNIATIKEVREEFVTRKELDLHIKHFGDSLDNTARAIAKLDENLGKLTEVLTTNVVSTLTASREN